MTPMFLYTILISPSITNAFAPINLYAYHAQPVHASRTTNVASVTSASNPFDARSRAATTPLHTIMATNNSGDSMEGGDDDDTKKNIRDEFFWAKQRAIAAEMTAKSDSGVRAEQLSKFAKRRLALTSDTFYFSILIGSLLWLVSPNPFVTISYLFGAVSGTAYSYGLGKYVESIGGSIDDEGVEGAGVGQARFAFLILLFVVVGKFRSQGLLEIPSIMGFFTYQLASLSQGLREIDD